MTDDYISYLAFVITRTNMFGENGGRKKPNLKICVLLF